MFDKGKDIPLNKKTMLKKKKVKKTHKKLIDILDSVDVISIQKTNTESKALEITESTEIAIPPLEIQPQEELEFNNNFIINEEASHNIDSTAKTTESPSIKYCVVPGICSFQENVNFIEGEYFVKLPVLLSQINISTDITASATIKNIKELLSVSNKIMIKECNVVDNTNVLFLKGILLDDIEYVDSSSKSLKHQLNQYLFYVTTTFEYIENLQSKNVILTNSSKTKSNKTILEDNFITTICEHNMREKIFYELISNKVTETIEKKDTEIKKYINIELSIRLFQNKIVKI